MNRALFQRNADACESATGSHCVCACGGALHGSKHSAAWRRETIGRLELEERQQVAATPDGQRTIRELQRVEQLAAL